MIDFSNIEQYQENNRIEAKKALGGLPHSIWETYSAFANTLGGIILLGVVENHDKTLHPINLPDPERLIREFWEIVKNPKWVSVNILTEKDVYVQEINGNRIIVIDIPRAQRLDRPVYLNSNPSCCYQRNGEGDYKCSPEDISSMLRDAAARTQDMEILEKLSLSVLSSESIAAYRNCLLRCEPDSDWTKPDSEDFLIQIGAAGIGQNGQMHPTGAGLLMFGKEPHISRQYGGYSLDYQEYLSGLPHPDIRIQSESGSWSGNLFDFYTTLSERLLPELSEQFSPDDRAAVAVSLREALANCLINADYHSKSGILILRSRQKITFSNPGGFRINLESARSCGSSDPRNTGLMKLFMLIDAGRGSGSGIPNIYRVWNRMGWSAPAISQNFSPERITLSLSIGKGGSEKTVIRIGNQQKYTKTALLKTAVISHLTDHISASCLEIAGLLGLKPSRAKKLLNEMIAENIIVSNDRRRNKIYKLKA